MRDYKRELEVLDVKIQRATRMSQLMSTVPDDRFNFNYWYSELGEGDDKTVYGALFAPQEEYCGTKACAMGWAGVSFQTEGLRAGPWVGQERSWVVTTPEGEEVEVDGNGFTAGALYFGMDGTTADRLFGGRCVGHATPKDSAREFGEWLDRLMQRREMLLGLMGDEYAEEVEAANKRLEEIQTAPPKTWAGAAQMAKPLMERSTFYEKMKEMLASVGGRK